jgi:hypothetical protein
MDNDKIASLIISNDGSKKFDDYILTKLIKNKSYFEEHKFYYSIYDKYSEYFHSGTNKKVFNFEIGLTHPNYTGDNLSYELCKYTVYEGNPVYDYYTAVNLVKSSQKSFSKFEDKRIILDKIKYENIQDERGKFIFKDLTSDYINNA